MKRISVNVGASHDLLIRREIGDIVLIKGEHCCFVKPIILIKTREECMFLGEALIEMAKKIEEEDL